MRQQLLVVLFHEGVRMPFNPCQRDLLPFKGDAHNVYLTVYRGQDRVQFRYIVCETCEDVLTQEWVSHALHKDKDGDWMLGSEELTLDDLWTEALPWENGSKSRQQRP